LYFMGVATQQQGWLLRRSSTSRKSLDHNQALAHDSKIILTNHDVNTIGQIIHCDLRCSPI
ncbi:MAG: hypothetical protein ACKO66_04655, partial [Flavobacteriales bacterium]